MLRYVALLLLLLGTLLPAQAPTGTLLLDLDGGVDRVTVTRAWARSTPWQAPRWNGTPTAWLVLRAADGNTLARVPIDLTPFNLHRDHRRGLTLVEGDRVFLPRVDTLAKIPDHGAALADLDLVRLEGGREVRIGGIDGAALRGRTLGGQTLAGPVVKTQQNNGPVENRYDIVILGDGYQAHEEALFYTNVSNWMKDLFGREPFKSYRAFFNVHTVFRASAQSGANHPDRTPPIVVNNAYGASYNTGGTARCLYITKASQAKADAALAPDVEGRIVVFVNDSRYGGCAGTFAVSYNGSSANAVQSHEFGHSFGRLADEYDYGRSGTYSGSEPSAANITADSTGATKWPLWLNHNGIGVYQGAGYYKLGLYRPKLNCLMRSLGAPLCEVCIEQLLKQGYVTTDPIEKPLPAGAITVTTPKPVNFTFTNLVPGGGQVTWFVDSQQAQTGGSSFTLLPGALGQGSHTVRVEVRDPSTRVRKDPGKVLHSAHEWAVSSSLGSDLTRLYVRDGAAGAGLGTAVAGPGDLDGDGHPDLLVATGATGAWALSGATGRRLYTVTGPCTVVAGVGDLDGDGRPDLALGDPGEGGNRGSVRILSGRNGSTLLRKLTGAATGDRFGHSICGLGDIDKDGRPDLAVGAPGAGGRGTVTLYAGGTWKTIRSFLGQGAGHRYGEALAALGDVNGDKVQDLAVGAPQAGTLGQVQIRSGANGALLRTLTDFFTGGLYGSALAGVGDVDGDGTPDVAVGSPLALGYGQVTVHSGRDGSLVHYLACLVNGGGFGTTVAGVGDLDGDGRGEILVGSPGEPGGGAWRLYSGSGGTVLHTGRGTGTGDRLGAALAGVGDLNGDGVPDFAAGAPGRASGAGRLVVATTASLLRGTTYSLSVLKGGTEPLSLDAGTAHAGKQYILLGSMTGTAPATRLDPVLLPLVVDPYTTLTVMLAAGPTFPLSLGTLDGQGRAAPGVSIPGNTLHPSMINMVLHHAALVIDGTRGTFDLATGAVPLILY